MATVFEKLNWKEQQEAANKKANFYTIVCKSRGEAERQLQKLQQR